MIRHVSCLTWKDGTTREQVDAIVAALEQLPALIPELRGYQVGRDVGAAAGNASLAVIADFDDLDGWRAYTENPDHQVVITERIRPVLAGRAAVQFETS